MNEALADIPSLFSLNEDTLQNNIIVLVVSLFTHGLVCSMHILLLFLL